MFLYSFPAGLTLSEVRAVVEAHNERLGVQSFIEADRGDHVIFNYIVSFDGSFPQPVTGDADLDRQYAILRECRGFIFCKHTEKPLARRFHKFFNVGEKEFTQPHVIDWSRPHVILEKLDGSMITPFKPFGANRIRWGTKMGATDVAIPVAEFVDAHPEYERLAEEAWLDMGVTPIFEWCSRKQKIVIDYPEDQLVLTALRSIETGEYLPYSVMQSVGAHFGIPVVRALPGSVENILEFVAETRELKDAEGYIIRFEDGHMVKIKADEYCAIHRTKDTLQFEKDVLGLILNEKMDDVKPFMDEADRERVDRYTEALDRAIAKTADGLTRVVTEARAIKDEKKYFAMEFAARMADPMQKGICFSIWDGHDPKEAVRKVLAKNTSTGTRVNGIRHLIGGLDWNDYRDTNINLDD